MRCAFVLLLLTAAFAQDSTAPLLTDKAAQDLATRMVQLMESTSVAVPDLMQAGEPIRKNAEATLASLARAGRDAALTWQFISQVKAWLALSDSIPRPAQFPAAADRQFAELREDTQRMQRHFEAILGEIDAGAQAYDADPDNLKRYAEANSKVLPPGKLGRVVFLGDSIADGWRLNEYFTGSDFINRGIEGQTTIQLLGRFMQDVVALHPKAVLIFGGINDIAHGIAPAGIEDNLTMMGALAKAYGIKPLFASVLPVGDAHKDIDPQFEMTRTHPPAAIQQLNRWLQDYCRKENFTCVDYYAAMADKAGHMPVDLSDDGLHPNSKGYRVMSPVTQQAINRVLTSAQQPEETPAKKRFRLFGN
ncbi:MAG: GDSL-type esterase/lipase family protein [Bryobacteraceae bacterium]|jgi:lysophospholipase L1-like esterase